MSAYSRPPFSVYVKGIDFNGDGTQDDLLPGTKVNQFNRGLGKDDLALLVAQYNQQFAGKPTASNPFAPRLTLPANYSFNDSFFTQDVRLSRSFSLGSDRVRLVLMRASVRSSAQAVHEHFNSARESVAVEQGDKAATLFEFGLQGFGYRGLTGRGQSGKPDAKAVSMILSLWVNQVDSRHSSTP